MRFTWIGVAIACCAVGAPAACDDSEGGGDTPPVGSERGPCDVGGACDEGLTCLSEVCVRVPDGGPGDPTIDAAPGAPDADLGPARATYDQFVKPILVAKCASCHETGGGGAPGFGTSFDTVTAYDGARGPLVGCTLTQSLLLAQGPHTGPWLDAAEQNSVRMFLEQWASIEPSCEEFAGLRPRTGPIHANFEDYLLDLSVMGLGLAGATLTFKVAEVPGGLELSDIVVSAGDVTGEGLLVVGPVAETCPGGVLAEATEFEAVHTIVPAGASRTIGDGTLSLPGASAQGFFAIDFLVLRPYAPAASPPSDVGGACLP